jgi:RHS repeat-associated protein
MKTKFILAAVLTLQSTAALAICDPESGNGCTINRAPGVALTSPTAGDASPEPGSFTLNATASDVDGEVESVEFFSNNQSVGIDSMAPYSVLLSGLARGSYQIYAKATDDTGKTNSTTPITVTVTVPTNPAPTVTLTGPTNGQVLSAPATVILSATASDANGIANVKFKSGSTVVATVNSYPYSVSYPNLAVGTYTFTAVATDNLGASSTSAPATVTVNSTPNNPPTVSLMTPSSGATMPAGGALTLTASAADTDGSITSVKFLANGSVLTSKPSAPYTFSWSTATPGSYSITALATDNKGATTTSIAASVSVLAAGTVSETRFYVYDSGKRLCKVINPESGATVIFYDVAGNISWTADGLDLPSTVDCQYDQVPVSKRTTREYDSRNRVTKVLTPEHTADVLTDYFPDGAIKKLTASNTGGFNVVTDYTYNKRRLLTSETQTNGVPQYSLGYAYNADGNLQELTYPGGEKVTYSLDGLGRITKVAGSGNVYASNVQYHLGGAIKSFTYGSGATHTMTQNGRRLPWQVIDAKGSTVILNDEYKYDANGNVTDITDLRTTGTSTTRGMSYDDLDRLEVAIGPWGTASYAYDALDNLRSANQGSRQFRYNYDANWRLATIKSPAGATLYSFSHDDAGNLVGKNSQHFGFDIANRMTSADVLSGIGSQVYRYDGLGRRVQTTDPDGDSDPTDDPKTYWTYSRAGQVMYSTEARRSRDVAYIYLGNSQIATRVQNWYPVSTVEVRYQHTDALGSPVVETDETASVASTKRTAYAPYGEALSPTIVDGAGYTGHVMDAGTGLTYMQQRYYDPSLGRFLTVDPALDSGRLFNRYAYAANSPFRGTDPDGRCPTNVPCWEATPSNFFRDNFIGRVASGLVGDSIAVFRSDGLNPLSNEYLEPSQLQAAKENLVITVATAGLGGEAVAGKNVSLATRTKQVHEVLDPIAKRMRTTAGAEAKSGQRVFGSGSRDLTPAQRQSLGAGESAARAPGAHAEVTVLKQLDKMGFEPKALEATRAFCPGCVEAIEAAGGVIESATRAVWK